MFRILDFIKYTIVKHFNTRLRLLLTFIPIGICFCIISYLSQLLGVKLSMLESISLNIIFLALSGILIYFYFNLIKKLTTAMHGHGQMNISCIMILMFCLPVTFFTFPVVIFLSEKIKKTSFAIKYIVSVLLGILLFTFYAISPFFNAVKSELIYSFVAPDIYHIVNIQEGLGSIEASMEKCLQVDKSSDCVSNETLNNFNDHEFSYSYLSMLAISYYYNYVSEHGERVENQFIADLTNLYNNACRKRISLIERYSFNVFLPSSFTLLLHQVKDKVVINDFFEEELTTLIEGQDEYFIKNLKNAILGTSCFN